MIQFEVYRRIRELLLCGLVLIVLVGCDQRASLVGAYHFGCQKPELNDQLPFDTLILHADGTFEQHAVWKSGLHYDSASGTWQYLGKNSIRLTSRKDFSSAVSELRDEEILKVELSHPHAILLPNGCGYGGPK